MLPVLLRILKGEQTEHELALPPALEIGRQRSGEPEPYAFLAGDGKSVPRLVYARSSESNVSRQHLLLECLEGIVVRVTNRSQANLIIQDPDRVHLGPGEATELGPPFHLSLAGRILSVSLAGLAEDSGLQSLDHQTVGPASNRDISSKLLRPLPADVPSDKMDALISWLQSAMGVLQACVGSADFLTRAVEALVQIVGLDSGRILLLTGNRWQTAAAHPHAEANRTGWKPSSKLMDLLRREKRTFLQTPDLKSDSASLQGMHAVVAALLDARGEVVGALYGERWRSVPSQPSGKLEATLVEILACGVATGLARQEEETARLRGRVQFEQFFGPELARQLELHPDMLKDREAEVTLLFCDVRGFSRISELIGPAQTMRWVSDVLSELSEKVLAAGGVLVDYIGDEMLVMFGAPQPSSDHAAQAVQAALAMRSTLPALNRRWQEMLVGQTMDIGIGINTGPAQVGNTGTRFKYQYGPLGNAVNLARHVQGMTKYLRCGFLATEATYGRLAPGAVLGRRVVRARVHNIHEPVDLYQIDAEGDPARRSFFKESEESLLALESGDFGRAARLASTLLQEHPGDGPTLLVLARAVDQLINPSKEFDPIWQPPGK